MRGRVDADGETKRFIASAAAQLSLSNDDSGRGLSRGKLGVES